MRGKDSRGAAGSGEDIVPSEQPAVREVHGVMGWCDKRDEGYLPAGWGKRAFQRA